MIKEVYVILNNQFKKDTHMNNIKEEYLGINKQIRKLENKQEDKKWGAGTRFVNIVLVILTGGIWLALMLVYWLLTLTLWDSTSGKLEKLYELRDEAELKMKGV